MNNGILIIAINICRIINTLDSNIPRNVVVYKPINNIYIINIIYTVNWKLKITV